MNGHFLRAFDHTLGLEKGYSNHPSDAGGATKYGVTEKTARAFGYTGDMKELPLETAQQIYKLQYWNPLLLDVIAPLAPNTSYELFDSAVNCGVSTAATWLQRCLNVLNVKHTVFKDIAVDGRIGLVTIAALQDHLKHRGDDSVLVRMLNSLQGAHYIAITEQRAANEDFLYGWFKNRVVI
ncbi:glycoside hydrolase family 108 protein [Caldimonas sp. KR1-144]|uniref:glycoside hydrolase family 108 protein n=1 Tax=Caldimonas sp. KR1-144 TaxID=3400911 RepID=UPI003C0B7799